MRKESIKKNGNKNGAAEDDENAENEGDVNGGGADSNQDPLQGADQPVVDIPKKKGRKKIDTVTEVKVPLTKNEANEDKDDGDDYEVEDIVDHKYEKKVRLFLVRWKNCSADEDTWEPESSLACRDILNKYIENNPDASSSSNRKRPAKKEKLVLPGKIQKKEKKTAPLIAEVVDDHDGDDGEDEFEVEEIVSHKVVRGKIQFLIRWKNYDSSGDTWEPESSLSCPELIASYKEKNMKDASTATKSKKEPKQKTNKEYIVQSIVDEKMQDGVKVYLVRWRGYTMDDDTWEPEDSLNCPELIVKFHEFKKNKRQSGARGSPKKLTYTEVDETDGEDVKTLYVNGSKNKKLSKTKPKKGGNNVKGKSQPQKAKEEDYEVEDIVGEKIENGKKFYFLKWKGWSSSNNTWELASSLSCPDILKKYQSKQKSVSATPDASTLSKNSTSGNAKKKKITKTKSKKSSKTTVKERSKANKSTKKTTAELEDEEEEEADWEVEKIIDVRYNEDGSKDFLIRWKGCDESQDTWEPEDNINSPELVTEFMNKTEDTDDVAVPKKKSRKA